MIFLSASCTDIGKKRKLNEDAILDDAGSGIWAVADGMGGHEAGEVASAQIVEALSEMKGGGGLQSDKDLACERLQEVNASLITLARNSGDDDKTIGSTVAALLIRDHQYCCIWAGDSRVYLVRDRTIAQLTTDHSLVNDLVRSGMVSPEEAVSHPDSNVITRAVGAKSQLVLDTCEDKVLAGDIFLLTTDGVNRVVSDEELCDILLTRNPGQAVETVRHAVLSRGAPDNLSIVVVRVA